ncbi:MAG TPA: helix-turn-helix domain-containing protein [Paludibacteraceae bacterium]|nr:helix-turn-helix domain-containing protein [Paludibacteraceae bacterium]
MIVVVFRPAGIRAFFPLPADRVFDLRLTAGDMEDKELAILESSVISAEDDSQCMLLIEQFLLKRCTRLAEYKLKRIEAAIRLIDSGQTNIASLADAACLSTKQLTRQFSEYVGANPKEFSQTIRFQRALHILETNPATSLTSLACEGGYYDQSHLIKDFKTLSGYTPGEYLSLCPPHSDYFN